MKIENGNSLNKFKEISINTNKGNRPFVIIGESGSGKSIIGLKLCYEGLHENYFVKLINLERYTNNFSLSVLKEELTELIKQNPDNDFLFYFDGLENLSFNKTKRNFSELIMTLLDREKNMVFISSKNNFSDPDSLLNIAILIRNSEKFFIAPVENPEKPWIKTPLEKVIFSEIKGKAKNNGALYYSYIEHILKSFEYILPEGYSIGDLKSDFQKIAFHSMSGQIKVDELKKYSINPWIETIIRDNKIINTDDNNFGSIVFNNNILRDFLTAGYLISLNSKDIENLHENFEEFKWRTTMLFIAEWLENNIIKLPKSILNSILYHLRQQKEFGKVDEIIKLIPNSESDYKSIQSFQLNLERATSFYFGAYYFESIKAIVKSISELTENNIKSPSTAKLYNLLAVCLNDLFLPSIAIKVADIGLLYSDEKQKPRLMGSKGRAYLRLGDFEKTEKFFNEKRTINAFLGMNEELRDDTDLLMLKSLKLNESLDSSIPSSLLWESLRILEEYKKREFEYDIDESGNKIYVFRNLSFVIPKINFSDLDIQKSLLDFIESTNDLSVKDYGPPGMCMFNIGKFYYKKGQKEISSKYLEKALKFFDNGNYKAEAYLSSLYLYLISSDENYIKKADNYYQSIQKEVFQVIDELNSKSLILDLFGIEISSNDFKLGKFHNSEINTIEKLLENQVVF